MRALWAAISPVSYYEQFCGPEANGAGKNVLVIYANYDLTFPREYSLKVVDAFGRSGVRHEVRVLPCGHYTTGETPFKFIDAWHMSWFVYRAYKALREEKARALKSGSASHREVEQEALMR